MNLTRVQACSVAALTAVSFSTAASAIEPANIVHASEPAWSPYLVGGLIGLLSMATFYWSDKPIGVSTAYARIAGMLGKIVAPRYTLGLNYFKETQPVIEWEVMLLAGILIGSLLAAWSGDQLVSRWIPELWQTRFGEDSVIPRLVSAFVGGIAMAFGARLAGGCTSGHGISGALQLSIGSWIALLCFFLGGIAAAIPLFG